MQALKEEEEAQFSDDPKDSPNGHLPNSHRDSEPEASASMTPAETPMNPSDSEDNASVDSISSNKMLELEQRNSTVIHSELVAEDDDEEEPQLSPNVFEDNFDDEANRIADKYNNMDSPSERHGSMDIQDKFDGNDNVSYLTAAQSHFRNMSNTSNQSGLPIEDMPIFTTYDDEDILREAEIESPSFAAEDSHDNHTGQRHQKR